MESNVTVRQSEYIPREHALAFHARSQRFGVMVWHRRVERDPAHRFLRELVVDAARQMGTEAAD